MKELIEIQNELKAPKGQTNAFGKYKYRSCEDITEAVKPLLHKHKCSLTISDTIVLIGDRYYIKATATITSKKEKSISVDGFAREAAEKKGMDSSQITGATSSYARKYALSGLFAIDDTKDADATNTHGKDSNVNRNIDVKPVIKKSPLEEILSENGIDKGEFAKFANIKTKKQADDLLLDRGALDALMTDFNNRNKQ